MKKCLWVLAAVLMVSGCGELPLAEYPEPGEERYEYSRSGDEGAESGLFYRCMEVRDGQTIVLDMDGIRTEVILLGVSVAPMGGGLDVSSPDLSAGPTIGWDAYTVLESLVRGRLVRLEYNFGEPQRGSTVSAFVFLENGTFVNAEMLKRGLGRADTSSLSHYRGTLERAEAQARKDRLGIWR